MSERAARASLAAGALEAAGGTGMMNREALAWAAGFFDGEGWTGVTRSRADLQPIIQIGQVDGTLLEHFRDCLGLKSIHWRQDYASRVDRYRRQPISMYRLNGHERVQAAIAMLWPWLGATKRLQARIALQRYLIALRYVKPAHRKSAR
jgi:hypothetical protein